MVPLPLHTQGLLTEVIAGGESALRTLRFLRTLSILRTLITLITRSLNPVNKADGGPCAAGHDGPAVLPRDGLQVGEAAKGAKVFLHHGPPLAGGVLNECALMDGVGLLVVPLLHEHPLFVGTEDVLRAEHGLTARPAAISGIYIIIVAYPVEVAALEAAAFAHHYLLLAEEVEVLVELAHDEVVDAADDIDAVAVEEEARVVVVAREATHRPLPFGVGGCEEPSPVVIAVDEEVELAIMVLDGRCPHASGVGILTVAEVVAVVVG